VVVAWCTMNVTEQTCGKTGKENTLLGWFEHLRKLWHARKRWSDRYGGRKAQLATSSHPQPAQTADGVVF
jgi:hypothetical protein